jgi:hypothetical protein
MVAAALSTTDVQRDQLARIAGSSTLPHRQVVQARALLWAADGMLPLAQVAGPQGELTSQVGKAVTGQGVLVQSVPADEGFWVGTSATDRVWVQLSGTGESGYVVKQGDRVDFTGKVVAHDPGFATQVGVDDAAEGANQLGQQGAHIEVARPQLRLSAA